LRAVCGEIGPDDGVDPRELARARMKQHRALNPRAEGVGRKARQLGRQVAETLDAVLAGDSRDELLRGLRVVSVVPAPDASRLLVTVAPRSPDEAERPDPVGMLARLERASGWLRTEVAGAVTRRKVPALTFRLALPGAERP
jgi:ribosome-binding factor A